jgi:hypothetical protein
MAAAAAATAPEVVIWEGSMALQARYRMRLAYPVVQLGGTGLGLRGGGALQWRELVAAGPALDYGLTLGLDANGTVIDYAIRLGGATAPLLFHGVLRGLPAAPAGGTARRGGAAAGAVGREEQQAKLEAEADKATAQIRGLIGGSLGLFSVIAAFQLLSTI